jgi:long-chain fatty acid transport protein
MLTIRRAKFAPLLFIIALFTGTVDVASGAGFQLLEQNASGLGNAYAGQAAAAENASAMHYNPASMTRLTGTQFSGSALGIRLSIEFSDSGASRAPNGAGIPAGGSNGGNAGGDWNYLSSLFLTRQIDSRLWLGLGLSAPFGLKTQYEPDFIGRFQSQKTVIKVYDINPGFAYKLSESVSIGAGLSYQHFTFKLDRSAFVGVEVPSHLELTSSDWGWNAGVLFTPARAVRVGLSHRSSVNHHMEGSVNIVGVPGFPLTATANVRLPATSSAALALDVSENLEVLGDFTYTHWSSIKAVPVVLSSGVVADTFDVQFRDGWRIGVGANYRWLQDLRLKFGIAFERSPVTSRYRTTSLPDDDRVWVGIGAKWALSKSATVDFGYAHAFGLWKANIDRQHGVGAPLAQGNVTGHSKNSIDILGVQYSHAF